MSKLLLPALTVAAIALIITVWPPQNIISQVINSPTPAAAADRMAQPPLHQTFTNSPYQLIVTATDSWQTPAATGQFYKGDTLLWQQTLPHQYGPRFVLVSQQGHILLLDEFINVASPYALTLLDADGKTLAQYSFDDIQKTLAIPAATLTQKATSGWWISAAPILKESEGLALVPTGGTILQVDLATGELRCDR